jgi:2'-5' RNA ligase
MPDSAAPQQRLFIALPCPLTPAISSALDELREVQLDPAMGLRIVATDTLHITLGFLGAVTADRIAGIHDAMHELRELPAPQLTIIGAGHFPSALWLGVQQTASLALTTLAQRCDQELRARGFELELRPYRPHVTVARIRNRRFNHDAWCEAQRDTPWATFTADNVHLYRSDTTSDGARYSVIHSVALSRPGQPGTEHVK